MNPADLVLAVHPAARAAELPDGFASNQLQMMGLLAAMAVLPFAIMMLTSFSKIVVVLSIVRSALGTQQAPPTMVITGLAAILSVTVMTPTVEKMWDAGKTHSWANVDSPTLMSQGAAVVLPLRDFLVKHGSPDERARFVDLARELRPADESDRVSEEDLSVIVPAFVITELKEAFIIGFLLFLPFLVLDMLTANVLLALGMQTLSPSQVSLPFKILLFVAVDGWALLSRGLLLGYR
ncbi:MAG: type III secretion system export apparatus subunit SctR [Myxococcaceae bacterium]